jgi:2-methylcitrate dehydratase PrpD
MDAISFFLVNTKYEDLPPVVVDHVKKLFLDTIGITIAGSSQEAIPQIVDLVKSWGGTKQSTILLYGGKVPAPNAAFAIGPMTRALDMGDTHPQAAHVSEYIFPAMLPAAEIRGKVSGKEFITAYALAQEVGCRLGNATQAWDGIRLGRHPHFGTLEASIAVAKLLGLNVSTTRNALGIAYHLTTAIDMQMYAEANLMIRGHHAFIAQDAINAVLLAQRGVTGAQKIFSGKYGMFAVHFPWEPKPDLLTIGLNKDWEMLHNAIKLYASCRYTHSAIDAVMSLVKDKKLRLSDITEISIEVDPGAYATVCEPRDNRMDPKTMMAGQFSMPYVVATALVKGKVYVDDYTQEELKNKAVRTLMPLVKCSPNNSLAICESVTQITLKDGVVHKKRLNIEELKGAFLNPLSWDEVVHKFNMSLPMSAFKIPEANIKQLIDKCKNLENVDNMNEIIQLLTP